MIPAKKITALPIVEVPHNVLFEPAKRVVKFDQSLITLLEGMKKTLITKKNPKGVGLAAVQVGIPLQIFLTKPDAKSHIRVFINPTITASQEPPEQRPAKNDTLEGCLSIPNVWGGVARSPTLTLSYQDETGAPHTETFSGFLATIIQHETDHCNGILFTRRVIEQEGKLYQIALDKDNKEVLEELHLP